MGLIVGVVDKLFEVGVGDALLVGLGVGVFFTLGVADGVEVGVVSPGVGV